MTVYNQYFFIFILLELYVIQSTDWNLEFVHLAGLIVQLSQDALDDILLFSWATQGIVHGWRSTNKDHDIVS